MFETTEQLFENNNHIDCMKLKGNKQKWKLILRNFVVCILSSDIWCYEVHFIHLERATI